MDIIDVIGELEHHFGMPIYDPRFRNYRIQIFVKPDDEVVEVELFENLKVISVVGNKTAKDMAELLNA